MGEAPRGFPCIVNKVFQEGCHWQLAASALAGRRYSFRNRTRLFPIASNRLDHQSHADRFRGDLNTDNLPIDDRADSLDVRFELPFRDSRGLAADTTEILGLTLASDRSPGPGLLARKMTNARHNLPQQIVPSTPPTRRILKANLPRTALQPDRPSVISDAVRSPGRAMSKAPPPLCYSVKMETYASPTARDGRSDLIRRAQGLDPGAFDALVDIYAARLYGFMYRFTGGREDAEDLVQELFLRVVRTIPTYEHDNRFDAWLFRVAGNLARDWVRRTRRTPATASLNSGDEIGTNGRQIQPTAGRQSTAGPDHRLRTVEDLDQLQNAMARLSQSEREVILLRHYGQMTFSEIAEMMEIPLGTALAKSHRALAKLREWMGATE